MPTVTFPLSEARSGGAVSIDVQGPELVVERCGSPVTLVLERDNQDRRPVSGPQTIRARCGERVGRVYIENEAADGELVLYWSREFCLEMGKGDRDPRATSLVWAPTAVGSNAWAALGHSLAGATATAFNGGTGIISRTGGGGFGVLHQYLAVDASNPTTQAGSYVRLPPHLWPHARIEPLAAGSDAGRGMKTIELAGRIAVVELGGGDSGALRARLNFGFTGGGSSQSPAGIMLSAEAGYPNWIAQVLRFNGTHDIVPLWRAITSIPVEARRIIHAAVEVGNVGSQPRVRFLINGDVVAELVGRLAASLDVDILQPQVGVFRNPAGVAVAAGVGFDGGLTLTIGDGNA